MYKMSSKKSLYNKNLALIVTFSFGIVYVHDKFSDNNVKLSPSTIYQPLNVTDSSLGTAINVTSSPAVTFSSSVLFCCYS